jgi:hypothetical protein
VVKVEGVSVTRLNMLWKLKLSLASSYVFSIAFCLFQLIAHIFINNFVLYCSNFSYIFWPIEAIFRENISTEEYFLI